MIGLIGEDPTDTKSISNLLKNTVNIRFKSVLSRIRGDQLNSKKTVKLFEKEVAFANYDLIIFIRDLDDFPSNHVKLRSRKDWFEEFSKLTSIPCILLINIQEIEALILADIKTFNKIYSSKITFKKNPEMQLNPKELLVRGTRNNRKKYRPSDNPLVFDHLNIKVVQSNCRYFREFLANFREQLTSLKS